MKFRRSMLVIIIGMATCAYAQSPNTTVESISNYQEWGWNALVMKNGLITIATVPVIGARIMQYDLGEHQSIFVNDNELGRTYSPRANSQWHNFGGYKVWPAPQDRWNWPPPPTLDFGEYSGEIIMNSSDSVVIFVSGPVEQWVTPNLRLTRKTTIYRGSSRVKVDQTIINEGSSSDSWSVWDVTQNIVNHPGEQDFENFWVYFIINPESQYGNDGVRYDNSSSAWTGEVAPGIYGVQFLPENKKIFADSHEGWICYVDEREGYAYAKTFELFEGAEYPDQGAHVEVWISGGPLYLEVEVVSPIVELTANGGSYTFTENWWAAKVNGPILGVNNVGAITSHADFDSTTGMLTGTFGVFYVGTAQAFFVDCQGNILGQGQEHAVTPLETFVLEEALTVPEKTSRIEIRVTDEAGNLVGVLDVVQLSASTNVSTNNDLIPKSMKLYQNYPNPFNPTTTIRFSLERPMKVVLKILDPQGREIDLIVSDEFSTGTHELVWNASQFASGVYIARLETESYYMTKKMLLLR
jgi:hypothetical protein